MEQTYVLPNRKAFADSIVRIFLKYKNKVIDPLDLADSEEDLCKRQGDMSRNSRELLEHQKIVKDYLLTETPYRGLLLYHGLGSGKTCSSIAVAESLLSTRHTYVLLPASLQENYRKEIRKCGDPIYKYEQHWEVKIIRSIEDREIGKKMGISDSFLDKNLKFYTTAPTKAPNFTTLARTDQLKIAEQLDDVLDQRFTFINYNGINKTNVDKVLPPDQPHMFDNTTVIIDEAHNLIGNVVNEREAKRKIYDMIYNAKNCKIVLLSGTPIINRGNEIAYTMNLLRGPIERVVIPTKQAISWDEGLMTAFFRRLLDVDTIEYNSVKRTILLTRNPPNFESVYNEKGERIAVKYNKDFPQDPDIKAWVQSWKPKFEAEFGGTEFETPEKFLVEQLECLPTDYKEFAGLFLDGLNVKNSLLFQRRIQGLVSYFKTADERLLPKEIEQSDRLVKIPMSDTQFIEYLTARFEEIKQESSRNVKKGDLNADMSSYRMKSRLICNYALPPEVRVDIPEGTTESTPVDLENSEILQKIKAKPEKYLSDAALKQFSPKLLRMLNDVKEAAGTPEKLNNIFIYSEFLQLQGLGIFAAILEQNGFQEYKIVKQDNQWVEDPNLKPGVPAFVFYDGTNAATRDLYRQIFNGPDNSGNYESGFPPSLKDSIREKKLCIFMGTKAAAEGIDLKKVRNVFITEPHWNPVRLEQAIGRAIRICSHAMLPLPERTVKVRVYITVFTPEQTVTQEGPNITVIRRNDMDMKRYEGDAKEAFLTSDEYLYELSYRKSRIIKNITHLLKQAAVDCEIHRKLHSKEQPVIQCMRFDTTVGAEDLAFKPKITQDETDSLYTKNIQRKSRRLQKIKVKGIALLIDPDTNEVFDLPSFDDTQRLIRLGKRVAPGEIRFFTPVSRSDFSSK
jgi:hypothetical protein